MAYSSSKKPSALNSASTPLAAGNQIVLDQNGNVVRASLADVEAKVFDAKTALSTPVGTEVVVVRQTDNTLRQVALSNIVPDLNITNDEISTSAAIADTKLATINTAGKVTNNAVQATSANTANRIVTRDGSGNFAAGTITATLSGNASTATLATTANQTANALTRGNYLTGNNFDGSAATTWAVDAATANTANKVVARDSSGNFAAGQITASAFVGPVTGNITGNVTGGLTGNVTGNVTGNLTGTASAIADGSVSTAKIVDGAVSQAKLGPDIILVPAGAVMPFAMNSAPTGWLAADGAAVSRSSYAALFAAIGTTYGSGDGSTTFNLPDLRGYFVRGSGTNSDGTASGSFGGKQGQEIQSHSHTGTTDSAGNHFHGYNDLYNTTNGARGGGGGAGWQTQFFEAFRNTFSAGAHTHTFTSNATGGAETRPKNIALLYCIKF